MTAYEAGMTGGWEARQIGRTEDRPRTVNAAHHFLFEQ